MQILITKMVLNFSTPQLRGWFFYSQLDYERVCRRSGRPAIDAKFPQEKPPTDSADQFGPYI